MPYNFSLGRGPTKASRHNAGKANTIDVPVIGIVKNNIDPTRSGKLQVFLTTNLTPLDPDNSDNWTTVSYLSNFFGSVRPTGGKDDFGSYKRNPSSYGEWHAPPDIGTKVICVFVNGDPNFGYYIGCIPETEDLYMVPAIGSSDYIIPNDGEATTYGGALRLPATNFNKDNREISESADYLNSPRPVHSYSASIMAQQGIIKDPIRGPISSSAQRETASRVGWGVSTPGRPIYEGGFNDETVTQNLSQEEAQKLRVISRRGGHSIVMDDGDLVGRDQLVRIRTALGHQILMSDDGQTLMILHSNGQSYIELGKEGTVDVYSTNSINMRTDGDINFHAGKNINFHANQDLKMHSKNFQADTEEELRLRSEDAIKMSSLGNYTVKSDADLSISSVGDSSIAAEGDAYFEGTKINLNSGSASTQPEEVAKIPLIAQTDTLFDKQQGFIAAPGKLMTITSRTPAHAPWAAAGQGVDTNTSLDAEDQLPPEPSPGVLNVNNLAGESLAAGQEDIQQSTGRIPAVKPVSGTLDQNTTNALLGSTANQALSESTSPTEGISLGDAGKDVTIGTFAQTPKQLANSGVLKPGSDRRINALANSLKQGAAQLAGQTVASLAQNEIRKRLTPSTLFTGKPGAKDINSLLSNIGAQSTSVSNNLQKAQSALTKMGAISGKEAPTQVAGLVAATSKFGLSSVKSTIQQVGNLGNAVGGQGTGVLKTIAQGALSAQLATTVTGGQGGIASALRAMDPSKAGGLLNNAKGVAGSAFDAIKKSFIPLTPNVPQNLTALAKEAGFGALPIGNQNLLTQTASLVQKGASASLGSLVASGIDKLPGGQKVVSAVLNNAPNVTDFLPGTDKIRDQINRVTSGELPSIDLGNPGSLLSNAAEGLATDAIAQLQSATSALSSGTSSDTKLPTVSFNTLNRQAISAKVDNLLSDPGIPPPNLIGEISEAATSAFESAIEKSKETFSLIENFEDFQNQIESARNQFYELESSLPAGDPRIQEAKDAWFALIDSPDYQSLIEEIAIAKGTGTGLLNPEQISEFGQAIVSTAVENIPDIDFNNLNNDRRS